MSRVMDFSNDIYNKYCDASRYLYKWKIAAPALVSMINDSKLVWDTNTIQNDVFEACYDYTDRMV